MYLRQFHSLDLLPEKVISHLVECIFGLPCQNLDIVEPHSHCILVYRFFSASFNNPLLILNVVCRCSNSWLNPKILESSILINLMRFCIIILIVTAASASVAIWEDSQMVEAKQRLGQILGFVSVFFFWIFLKSRI